MSLIQDAVQQGLSALRSLEIQKTVTYLKVGTPTYNPTTGAPATPQTSYPNIHVVLTSFAKAEIDGDAVRSEDRKAIIAQLDLAVTPTPNDRLQLADGTVWSVIHIGIDPADAAWVLQLRRP